MRSMVEGAAEAIDLVRSSAAFYGDRMRVTSASALRRNLAKMIDETVDDHVPLIVTRRGGKPAAVLMSFEDFSWYENVGPSAEQLSRDHASPRRKP